MSGGQEVFVKLKLFNSMSKHPSLQMRPVAHDHKRRQKVTMWVQDDQILAQVFIADDFTSESSAEEKKYLVFSKGPLRPSSNTSGL